MADDENPNSMEEENLNNAGMEDENVNAAENTENGFGGEEQNDGEADKGNKADSKAALKKYKNPAQRFHIKDERVKQYPEDRTLQQDKKKFDQLTRRSIDLQERGEKAHTALQAKKAETELKIVDTQQKGSALKIHTKLLVDDLKAASTPLGRVKKGCSGCFASMNVIVLMVVGSSCLISGILSLTGVI